MPTHGEGDELKHDEQQQQQQQQHDWPTTTPTTATTTTPTTPTATTPNGGTSTPEDPCSISTSTEEHTSSSGPTSTPSSPGNSMLLVNGDEAGRLMEDTDENDLEHDHTEQEAVLNNADLPWWRRDGQDDLVISGISGRFPESNNMAEFAEHLFNGDDLVTEDDRRWTPGFYDLPRRNGKLKIVNKFDAQFFGVSPRQANNLDPQIRLLLEVVHEAIVDAGINPSSIRGTRTGVFVGASGSETMSALTRDPEQVSGYTAPGCFMSMFANRISYSFDFRGPSFPVDTACSSSLLALQLAVDALRQGHCDAAIVAGTSLTLTPNTALQFLRFGMLSDEGKSKSFDADGSGYVRSEGIVAIYIQKASIARRVYATVVHAKSNTDGYKQAGITVPNGEQQAVLLEEVYRESGIDPRDVSYVEAHGTGTKVGDPQECYAITEIFCRDREDPLLIGSVKSNMGHSEPASGLCAVAKVLIAMESGMIPPNLHFNEPNPYIPGLQDGRLKVVDKPMPWNGGYVGINSFGFGGANTHVLLRSNQVLNHPDRMGVPSQPKLFCFAGRTQEGVQSGVTAVNENLSNKSFYALMSQQSNMNPSQCLYRGFAILNRPDDAEPTVNIKKVPNMTDGKRPVWFAYSGMGSQWPGMAHQLMTIEVFKQSLLESSDALRPLGVDPYSLIMQGEKDIFSNTMHCMVSITAIQIALTDTLRLMGVQPDGIVGHSTGEMACGYADQCLTRAQTMLLAYHRGQSIMQGGLQGTGAMAAVGLTWEEAHKQLPVGVIPACHNAGDSVTISGDTEKVHQFVEELKAKETFAKIVNSSGVPFHSPKMLKIKDDLIKRFRAVIPTAKRRSTRWASSSVPEEEWDSSLAATCSAEYQANNAIKPVLFYEALQHVPENAVVIDIGPHALLLALLRRTLPSSCTPIGLMKANHENEHEFFLSNIGSLYQSGVYVAADKLYDAVPFPVPRGTPMISPLVKWDHSQDWLVVSGKETALGGGGMQTSASYKVEPNASESKDTYILDHVIDGRPLYPFAGYIHLAWRTICKVKGLEWHKTPVVLHNIKVHKPTIVGKSIKFDVTVSPGDGHFEVIENDQIAASGQIFVIDDDHPDKGVNKDEQFPVPDSIDELPLEPADIYKELSLRGYEYKTQFRDLQRVYPNASLADVVWKDNWVTFIDALLQTSVFLEKEDTLKLPTTVRYMRLDPDLHLKSVCEQDGVQIIKAISDVDTKECVAGGVHMAELEALSVPRRVQHVGLFHENVEFTPHHDEHCFRRKPDQRQQLIDYTNFLVSQLTPNGNHWLQVVKDMEHSVLLLEAMKNLTQQQKNGNNNNEYKTHAISVVDQQSAKLADVLHELVVCQSLEAMRTCVSSRLPELHADPLYSVSSSQRAMKGLLDITQESKAGHSNRFCGVALTDLHMCRQVHDMTNTHPLIEQEWVFATPDAAKFTADIPDAWSKTCIDFDLYSSDAIPKNLSTCCDTMLLDRALQWAIDIPRALQRIKELLRDDGFVLAIEYTAQYELAFAIDAFRQERLPSIGDSSRIYGLYYRHEDWVNVFESSGLKVAGHQTDESHMTTIYLLHKQPATPRQPTVIDINDVKYFDWIKPLQDAIEERLGQDDTSTIWLKSDKTIDNGAVGLGLCLREEGGAKANRIRVAQNVNLHETDPKPDEDSLQQIMADDLHSNCYRNGQWGSYRHYTVEEGGSHAYRLCEHACMNATVRGDLSSIRWIESTNQFFDVMDKPNDHVMLCSVYYAPLNFRDIMIATGRLNVEAIPDVAGSLGDRECLLGTEFAGRLQTGERVMGLLPGRALATTCVVDDRYTFPVPDKWTLEEASTVPVVYCTAFYALCVRGKMAAGESILIHSGSGGVGQAAISVALSMNCRVYTTVGTAEKREFLKQRFPRLSDAHIFNSRTMQFERDILRATRGKGVDLVLNSLAEDKLQASVRCIAQRGRFLEIGKFDLNNNSALGMKLFLKNVTFHGILLDALTEGTDVDWVTVAQLFRDGIRNGIVKPMPSTLYPAAQVEDAFRYMASGKHIGKVVVQVRPEEPSLCCVPSPMRVRALGRSMCHPRHSFLITGGLGGFGLELAQWLVNRGATRLILTSRTGIRTGYQARCVASWRAKGVQYQQHIQVSVSTRNIADSTDAEALVNDCLQMGPLAGIFHLAMVLRDTLFETQSMENFSDAAQMKYHGTKNLDELTRRLCGEELKWFVVFSSITAGRGNSGQTNYGWANSTMERVIEQRRHEGYPGIAIQWGAIGDVGVIIDSMGDNSTVVGGTLPQRMPSCLQALDEFLTWNEPLVSSYVRAEVGKQESSSAGDVLSAVAHIIGVSDVATLDLDSNLADLGIDSLMGVEIRQVLERDYDIVLSMKHIRTLSLKKLQAIANGELDLKDVSPEGDGDTANQAEMEQQMNKLFKLRIDVNTIMAEEGMTKVNEVNEGPNVYFVHSIEGIATPLRKLCDQLPFIAYCFQCTPDTPNDTIEQMAEHYIKLMQAHQPSGPYNLVGYSYGACIAYEMACQLQNQGILSHLVLLDGSHHYMRTYRKAYRIAYDVDTVNIANHPLFETELLAAFAQRFSTFDYTEIRKNMLALPDWSARVAEITKVVMATGLFQKEDTFVWGCNSVRQKFFAADKYRPDHEYVGDVSLLRAEHGAGKEADIGSDYGLGSVVTGKVRVQVIEGDHDSMVQGSTSDKTASALTREFMGTD